MIDEFRLVGHALSKLAATLDNDDLKALDRAADMRLTPEAAEQRVRKKRALRRQCEQLARQLRRSDEGGR